MILSRENNFQRGKNHFFHPASYILCRTMAYDRRNLNLYHRGGGGGNPLSSSYRNKAILIVGATALYTAFLYNSGMFGQLFFVRLFCLLLGRWTSLDILLFISFIICNIHN